MKKMTRELKFRIMAFTICLISIVGTMGYTINSETEMIKKASSDYKDKLIRFHCIANSDTDEDQALKLKVRDEVIAYLQPKLKGSKSVGESENIIKSEIDKLKEISAEVIEDNGYDYKVDVALTHSQFPTKQYSNVVLPAGEYKALKIIIGSGQGRNWWCVMFPPLCFVDDTNAVIDKETDDKLRNALTEEEYKLIAGKDKGDAEDKKLKFKTVELIEKLQKK
ncbi:MAG: stage II sporulation protein R [Clostridioides sp.]|nr:stage II sporulation protein R [Clostridioides sp.]